MPATVQHVFTSPIADGTNTQIVRPSDWNQTHVILGLGDAAEYNVGTNASNVLARSNADGLYLTTAQPPGAYLTTAALSNHSHAFATTTTGGSNIVVGTTNSAGVTIGVPAFLTTAAPVGAYLTTARASNDAIGLNTALTANGVSMTANSSGLSLNFPAFLTTAQAPGAYLTTAALSNHSHGAIAFGGTNVSGSFTSASNGLSISLSAGAGGAGDGVNIIAAGGSTANSTGTIVFSNSNGVSFGLNGATVTASHNGLTTAAQSNHSHAFATTTTNGASIVVATTNSNGVTIAVPPYLTTAQAPGAYLTTARASNDAIGLNSAFTAGPLAMTINSSGLSLNAGSAAGTTSGFAGNSISGSMTHNTAGLNLSLNHPAWITTAAQSNHSHGNPTLALTNLSGTTASNSAGLTLSLSAAAAGGGGVAISAGGSNFTNGTVTFGNANGFSFITSNGSVVGSYTDAGAGAGISAVVVSAGTTNNAISNMSFSDANGVSFGIDGSTITASVAAGGGGSVGQYWACPQWAGPVAALITNITAINNRPFFMPFRVNGTLSAGELMWVMSRSTSGSNAFTVDMGIYGYSNYTVISRLTSAQNVYSQTATASISGIRQFEFNMASFTLPPGDYVMGMLFSAANTASMNYSLVGATTANPFAGVVISGSDAYHTYTSHQPIPMEGRYTTTSTALPGTVSQAGIIGGFTGASANLRPNWTLATHN